MTMEETHEVRRDDGVYQVQCKFGTERGKREILKELIWKECRGH